MRQAAGKTSCSPAAASVAAQPLQVIQIVFVADFEEVIPGQTIDAEQGADGTELTSSDILPIFRPPPHPSLASVSQC